MYRPAAITSVAGASWRSPHWNRESRDYKIQHKFQLDGGSSLTLTHLSNAALLSPHLALTRRDSTGTRSDPQPFIASSLNCRQLEAACLPSRPRPPAQRSLPWVDHHECHLSLTPRSRCKKHFQLSSDMGNSFHVKGLFRLGCHGTVYQQPMLVYKPFASRI